MCSNVNYQRIEPADAHVLEKYLKPDELNSKLSNGFEDVGQRENWGDLLLCVKSFYVANKIIDCRVSFNSPRNMYWPHGQHENKQMYFYSIKNIFVIEEILIFNLQEIDGYNMKCN